jgi:hypothetical protein
MAKCESDYIDNWLRNDESYFMDGSEELHFENIIFRAQFISS